MGGGIGAGELGHRTWPPNLAARIGINRLDTTELGLTSERLTRRDLGFGRLEFWKT
jgi:hypothetical protein